MLATTTSAAELDTALAKVMSGRSGTAVVMNVATGKILGAYRLDIAARTLARPGSAFKPFTLMALLDSGKVKPDELFTCRRSLHVGTHNLSCSHPPASPLQAV